MKKQKGRMTASELIARAEQTARSRAENALSEKEITIAGIAAAIGRTEGVVLVMLRKGSLPPAAHVVGGEMRWRYVEIEPMLIALGMMPEPARGEERAPSAPRGPSSTTARRKFLAALTPAERAEAIRAARRAGGLRAAARLRAERVEQVVSPVAHDPEERERKLARRRALRRGEASADEGEIFVEEESLTENLGLSLIEWTCNHTVAEHDRSGWVVS